MKLKRVFYLGDEFRVLNQCTVRRKKMLPLKSVVNLKVPIFCVSPDLL